MAWPLALVYIVTLGLFVAAAWIAGAASICDTCQRQNYSGIEPALIIAGAVGVVVSVAVTRYSVRRRR